MLFHLFKLLWRRRERLSLIVIGIVLVSLAASLAAVTARSTQGTLDEELARHWRTDYDLLIRSPAAVSELEQERDAIPGNYQTNISGDRGINPVLLRQIREIPGVEVAAPLVMVGYAQLYDPLFEVELEPDTLEPGVYKKSITWLLDDGFQEIRRGNETYHVFDPDETDVLAEWKASEYGYELDIHYAPVWLDLNYYSYTMVAAIDPEAEAQLTGLDKALVDGVYFTDYIPGEHSGSGSAEDIRALFSIGIPASQRAVLEIFRLDPDTGEEILVYSQYADFRGETLGDRDDWAGWHSRIGQPMEYVEGTNLAVYAWGRAQDIDYVFTRDDRIFFDYLRGKESVPLFCYPGEEFPPSTPGGLQMIGTFDPDQVDILSRDSPIAAPMELYHFQPVKILELGDGTMPQQPRYAQPAHPLSYGGLPVGILIDIRSAPLMLERYLIDSIRVRVSGVEDMTERSQVRIAAVAQEIREKTGLQVDIVLGSSRQRNQVDLYDYAGEKWAAYREEVSERMAAIVPQLEAQTGMDVTWDFGSHPHSFTPFVSIGLPYIDHVEEEEKWRQQEEFRQQLYQDITQLLQEQLGDVSDMETVKLNQNCRALADNTIHLLIPDYEIKNKDEQTLLGRVEEYWIQLGTQMRIYHETNRGTFWITLGLLAVSGLFIGNTTYISTLGRRSEFSSLRTLGWRRVTVFCSALGETLIIALMAGAVVFAIMTAVWSLTGSYIDPLIALLLVAAVIATFVLGSLPPLLRTVVIQPLAGLSWGEISRTRLGGARTAGFVLRGLAARPGRTAVTIFALLVPGCLLAFMLLVHFGIQQLLGETMLGEYLALEFKGHHYALNALVFAVAALVVTDTLLVSLRERQKEFGLLKAVGWRNRTVAGLLLWEGVSLGVFGGILGIGAGTGIYWHLFGRIPESMPLIAFASLAASALVAGVAAVVPVLRAAALPPAQVIKEE